MSTVFGIAEKIQTACVWEVTARKLGNVHRHADFRDTSYLDFILSGIAIAPYFQGETIRDVGLTILSAVEATRTAVGRNTNLGMILLFAPLAAVAEREPLNPGVWDVLNSLTHRDARHVYEAIRLASPGGLGDSAKEDVRHEPSVTLLEAMRLAADRDLIARQYVTGFADIFEFGLPVLLEELEQRGSLEAAIVALQLRWLATELDSLIARKNGEKVAARVRERAREILDLGGIDTVAGRKACLEFDRDLRSDVNRLNPGTIADLIAACLFAALRENRLMASSPFGWHVQDWL